MDIALAVFVGRSGSAPGTTATRKDFYNWSFLEMLGSIKPLDVNPTLLDGRDAILRALDDLLTVRRIPADVHRRVRAAIWQAFAAFGMGVGASSVDADVQGIVADNNVSRDLIA